MGYDTIKLRSPFLDIETASRIEKECFKRQGIDLKTGELRYEITTGELEGSYDHRLQVKVEKVPEPRLVVNGSVHKSMLGHNIYGAPTDFYLSCKWMVSLVEKLIDEKLPCVDGWEVMQVDVAHVFKFNSFEAVQEYIKGLQTCSFPRRSTLRYGFENITFPGLSTTIKFYHKGPEFWKHDRKRLKDYLTLNELNELINFANLILRVEVAIKSKKLKYDFNGRNPLVTDLSNQYLENVYHYEVRKILKEGQSEMATVRNTRDVEARLNTYYADRPRLATSLFTTWVKLSTFGENEVKRSVERTKLYRHKKLLVEAGCAWDGTDLKIVDTSLIPENFVPYKENNLCYMEVAPKVQECLKLMTA